MNIRSFVLTNQQGSQVTITNYGGIVTSILTRDQSGQLDDIVLGFDQTEAYRQAHPYFGAIIGRYGNRIAGGKFLLNGKEYTLATNNGPNHLHGGMQGFDKAIWNPAFFPSENRLKLNYLSPDGEEGYPGNLEVTVTYTLSEDNKLTIEYEAMTNRATPVNLTNHSYFNLAGKKAEDILGHQVYINAAYYIPVNKDMIPTGEIRPVQDTPFDFSEQKAIAQDIAQVAGGFDHTFVLKKSKPGTLSLAAKVYEPQTGRTLEVLTTEPGIQFYSGNFLDGSITGKDGRVYKKHTGFCIEAQHFPDSPNQPKFPDTILTPGETYRQTTIYKFGVR